MAWEASTTTTQVIIYALTIARIVRCLELAPKKWKITLCGWMFSPPGVGNKEYDFLDGGSRETKNLVSGDTWDGNKYDLNLNNSSERI
jgi:hypothetical protein